MTQDKILLATELMAQMDLDIQEYVIDMLRHMKFAQNTIQKQNAMPTISNT